MEVARGDDVTLTCHFKPKNQVNDLIIVTWIGDADDIWREGKPEKLQLSTKTP